MEAEGAVAAQYDLMGSPPGTALSFGMIELDDWVLRAFERDWESEIDALLASALLLPTIYRIALRADGGLWLVVGHDSLSVIFSVPPDAWMPTAPVAWAREGGRRFAP